MVPSLGFSSWAHMNLDYKDNEYLFKNTACQVFYNGPPARVPPPEVMGTVHAWQSAGTSLPALQLAAEAEAAGSTSAFCEQGDPGGTVSPKSTRCLAHC